MNHRLVLREPPRLRVDARQLAPAVLGMLSPEEVLRLRLPFDPKQFPSARSEALRAAVRSELDTVLQRAAAR